MYIRDKGIDDIFIFEFGEFSSNSKYQVIVSFPGYLPIECSSNISQHNVYDHRNGEDGGERWWNGADRPHQERGLLDTDVGTFHTGNRAVDQTIIKITVQCQPLNQLAFDQMIESGAALQSLRKMGKVNVSEHIVQFAIKVESMWFGGIPNSLIGLTIIAVIAFMLILWMAPCLLRIIKDKDE